MKKTAIQRIESWIMLDASKSSIQHAMQHYKWNSSRFLSFVIANSIPHYISSIHKLGFAEWCSLFLSLRFFLHHLFIHSGTNLHITMQWEIGMYGLGEWELRLHFHVSIVLQKRFEVKNLHPSFYFHPILVLKCCLYKFVCWSMELTVYYATENSF